MKSQSSFNKKNFRKSVFADEAGVLQSGYLQKQSTGVFKRWQKRYFVISTHYLKYYESKSDSDNESKIRGTIDLKETLSVNVPNTMNQEFHLNTASDVAKVGYYPRSDKKLSITNCVPCMCTTVQMHQRRRGTAMEVSH
jgi:hypothetical protein